DRREPPLRRADARSADACVRGRVRAPSRRRACRRGGEWDRGARDRVPVPRCRGGEVVVPANTFYATAGAVVHAGGTPRFADIDVATLALSPATIETALTERTRAVVLVHIGGLITPAVGAIARLCGERGIALVEDAAHAHGSS